MAKEGYLPLQDVGRTEAAASMEHGAPLEILPVERYWTMNSPYFLA